MQDKFLISRLRNCLNTILELEEALQRSANGDILREEFATLKRVLETLDSIAFMEEDVARIEQATIQFLEEIKKPLRDITLFTVAAPRHIH